MGFGRRTTITLSAIVCSVAACSSVLGIDEKHAPAENVAAASSTSSSSTGGGGDGGSGGCSTNLMTDGANCGACGRDCQGGACEEGQCLPVQIAFASRPNGLGIDDDYVYWTEFSGEVVHRARKDGSDNILLLSVPFHYPAEIVVASNAVYVTVYGDNADGWIARVEKDGSASTILSKPWDTPWGITVDGTHVYWTNRYDTTLVVKAPLDGGAPSPLQTVAGVLPVTDYQPIDIAVDDTFIYFTEITPGKLWRMQKDGTEASVRWTGLSGALAIAVDATSLYWSDLGDLYAMPKDASDGKASMLYKSSYTIAGIALDGGWVYFTTDGAPGTMVGRIWRVPVDGSAPAEVLMKGLYSPGRITVDEKAIYWTEQIANAVKKLAKP